MAHILLVDADKASNDRIACGLAALGHIVVSAASGRTALESVAASRALDVVVLEVRLPDMSGTAVQAELRRHGHNVQVIMATGYASLETAIQSFKLGARDYLEKPIQVDQLAARIEALIRNEGAGARSEGEIIYHGFDRWAFAVVRAIECPFDPKTLLRWGRWVAVSPGALRSWCRTLRVSPKNYLRFTRVLRAVHLQRPDVCPYHLLDVSDARTLAKLLSLGHDSAPLPLVLPSTADEFLKTQSWITDCSALTSVRRLMQARTDLIEIQK